MDRSTKIVSAYQPYFAPYGGFFEKALGSHYLVLLDDVQFPRGTTWLTRNRFKNDQGTLWLTIPVWKKGLGLQKIKDVKICHQGGWARKHLASITTAYKNAPYFPDHQDFVTKIFTETYTFLLDINLEIIRYVLDYLGASVELVLLSELGITSKEPDLSVDLAKALGASHFLAQSSARKYLVPERFQEAGIELIFFNPRPIVYPQLWGEFIPNLSILDMIFNCGPRTAQMVRKGPRATKIQIP